MNEPNDTRYAKEVLYFVSQVGNEEPLRILQDFASSTSKTSEMQELFAYAKGCYDTLAATRLVGKSEIIASNFLLRPSQAPNYDKELLRTIDDEETHQTD